MRFQLFTVICFVATLFFFSCDEKNGGTSDVVSPLDTVKSGKEQVLESLLRFDSEEELKKEFGAQRITRDTAYKYSILDAGTISEVEFWWSDSTNHSELFMVAIKAHAIPEGSPYNYQSSWKTLNGIKLGMTSGELEKMNGKPFAHHGFHLAIFSSLFGAYDSAGYIFDWKAGRLGNCKWLSVELNADSPAANNLSKEEEEQVEAWDNVMSNHPVVRKIQPRVWNIMLFKKDYPAE